MKLQNSNQQRSSKLLIWWSVGSLILTFTVHLVDTQAAFMLSKGQMHPVYKGFIVFENTVTNVSSRLVPEFGVFTCSSAGTYQFTMCAATQRNQPFRIAIKLNQSSVATMYGSPNDYQQVAQTVVIQLENGDFVYPFVEVGDIFESAIQDRAYTVFSGFQVNTVAPEPGTRTTESGIGTSPGPTSASAVTTGGTIPPAVTTRATTLSPAVTTRGATSPLTATTRATTATTRSTARAMTTAATTTRRQRAELDYADMLAIPDEGDVDTEQLRDLLEESITKHSADTNDDDERI